MQIKFLLYLNPKTITLNFEITKINIIHAWKSLLNKKGKEIEGNKFVTAANRKFKFYTFW